MAYPVSSLLVSIILASLLAVGSSLLLIRRGPTQRLRQLTLTVGLISLAQTAELLQSLWTRPQWVTEANGTSKVLMAALSLMAIYILKNEIRDRNATKRQIRILEHAIPPPRTSGSGYRFLQALGLTAKAELPEEEGNPLPVTRGSVVRVARNSESEGMLGEVTDCRRELSGKTFLVSIRVGLSRDETLASRRRDE